MNLPENIINALKVDKLKREHPVRFELFEFHSIPGGLMLRRAGGDIYNNADEAHEGAAKRIEESPNRYPKITYLPVVF